MCVADVKKEKANFKSLIVWNKIPKLKVSQGKISKYQNYTPWFHCPRQILFKENKMWPIKVSDISVCIMLHIKQVQKINEEYV